MLSTVLYSSITNADISIMNKNENSDDQWFYLSSYSNYAPHGLPDFSQLQQLDWQGLDGHANLCGAVSLADIIWWLDSKHSDPNGFPGDGIDEYPLVSLIHDNSNPCPGPYADDHDFNNVNDLTTPWNRKEKTGELIEQIGYYTNNWKDSKLIYSLNPAIGSIISGYYSFIGPIKWFNKQGLLQNYYFIPIVKPSFDVVVKNIMHNNPVMLGLSGYDPINDSNWGHFVAVAGVKESGKIALSDPYFDIANYTENQTLHNDANYVSHDIYDISPENRKVKWSIIDYDNYPAYVRYAFVIKEKN